MPVGLEPASNASRVGAGEQCLQASEAPQLSEWSLGGDPALVVLKGLCKSLGLRSALAIRISQNIRRSGLRRGDSA